MNGWLRLTDAEFEQHSCALLDCPDDHFHAEGVEAIVAARLAEAWDEGYDRGCDAANGWPESVNPYRAAVLGSDAHTQQKGAGE